MSILILLAFGSYYLLSPWKVVIEIRSAYDLSKPGSDEPANALNPTLGGSSTLLDEARPKKDYIEPNFGDIEEAYLKSIGQPSNFAIRSRDDSIKMIYDIQDDTDWLTLIEGHDDHVCLPLLEMGLDGC